MSDIKIPGTRYLVGGAVRDELLGITPTERDWVVVGADPETMLEAGFIPIGKAFPVFLHPKTFEEHALARTETKIGPGHGGFSFKNDSSVTLEEDLMRRDLTINAIAKSDSGELIDPSGGQKDLRNQILRHVSVAFSEDPLRCYRVARFAARLPSFEVFPATMELIRSMAPQLQELSAERVWNEWVTALDEDTPYRFYEILRKAEITEPWFRELDLDVLIKTHTERKLPLQGSFALIGWLHSKRSLDAFFDRLAAPKKAKSLALEVRKFGRQIERFEELSDHEALSLMDRIGAFHGDSRFEDFLRSLNHVISVPEKWLIELRRELRKVKVSGESSKELGHRLQLKRLAKFTEIRNKNLQ